MAAPLRSPNKPRDHDLPSRAASTSSNVPHKMRIASGGSISHYVLFALKFLTEHLGQPLILHTLPPADPPPSHSVPTSSSTLHPSTLTASRLISVVELIKRSYISQIRSQGGGGKGKNRAAGLWQYTETGLVGESEIRDGGNELERAISGRNKPKMTHRPYLQISLCTRPLGWESRHGVTCQYILVGSRKRRKGGDQAEMEGMRDKGEAEGGLAPGQEGGDTMIPAKDGERAEVDTSAGPLNKQDIVDRTSDKRGQSRPAEQPRKEGKVTKQKAQKRKREASQPSENATSKRLRPKGSSEKSDKALG